MALINCPECGKEISDKANMCPNCGNPVAKKKYCKFCGDEIDIDCVICPKCGKQVENLTSPDRNLVINNSSYASSYSTAPVQSVRKLPWYLRGGWIFFLGCLSGGVYWIVGIILRVLWRSHN